uniref:Uncharacterized protein n=1 Tax=Cacopsylla melanoneura TaxID=428564 RepID=A0A8D9C0A6_9HEMI
MCLRTTGLTSLLYPIKLDANIQHSASVILIYFVWTEDNIYLTFDKMEGTTDIPSPLILLVLLLFLSYSSSSVISPPLLFLLFLSYYSSSSSLIPPPLLFLLLLYYSSYSSLILDF